MFLNMMIWVFSVESIPAPSRKIVERAQSFTCGIHNMHVMFDDFVVFELFVCLFSWVSCYN